MTSGEPQHLLDPCHKSASDILPEQGLTSREEAPTIDLLAPAQTGQETDNERGFISDASSGRCCPHTAGLLEGVREASEVAFRGSTRSGGATQRVTGELRASTGYEASRQVICEKQFHKTSPVGVCVVRTRGDARPQQGIGASDGQLTVAGLSTSKAQSVRPKELGLARRRRANTVNANGTAGVQAMLKRLRPFDEWAADLPLNSAVHSQPGGARVFYDNFRAALEGVADGTMPSPKGWISPKPARRPGCQRAPQRECTDSTVIARLKECGGMRYQSATLALYFKVPTKQMSERLRRLVTEGQIRSMRAETHTLFYFPTKEELVAEEAVRSEERGRIGWRSSATLRIWRQGDPELVAYTQQMTNET